MTDEEVIRLECLRAADGNVQRAEEMYEFVRGEDVKIKDKPQKTARPGSYASLNEWADDLGVKTVFQDGMTVEDYFGGLSEVVDAMLTRMDAKLG